MYSSLTVQAFLLFTLEFCIKQLDQPSKTWLISTKCFKRSIIWSDIYFHSFNLSLTFSMWILRINQRMVSLWKSLRLCLLMYLLFLSQKVLILSSICSSFQFTATIFTFLVIDDQEPQYTIIYVVFAFLVRFAPKSATRIILLKVVIGNANTPSKSPVTNTS